MASVNKIFKDFRIMSIGALLPSSMASRAPIESGQKPYTAFPDDDLHEI